MLSHKQSRDLRLLNLCAGSYSALTFTALATAISYIAGGITVTFSFLTGIFLTALGIGTLWGEKLAVESEKAARLILLNSLAAVLLANPGIWGIMGANEILRHILRAWHLDLLFLILPAGAALTLGLGIVSGARLSLVLKSVREAEPSKAATPAIQILTSDYFWAFAGIIGFMFILNPFLGLVRGILLSQIIMLGVIDLTFLRLSLKSKPLSLKLLLLGANIYAAAAALGLNAFLNFLNAMSGL